MRRRDFLHPRHAAGAAGQAAALAAALAPDAPSPDAPAAADEVALVRLGWRAMATRFEVLTPLSHPRAVEAAADAFELLDQIEDQLTAYRDHSEVCRLNRAAPARPVRVEAHLFDLLQQAQQIHRDSDGAFDPAAGALIKAWGFFRGPRRVPAPDELAAALARTGLRHVQFCPKTRTARFLTPGVELNLGSIGKGHALDRLAERLARHYKLPAVLLHGGSSSVYAKGCPHGESRGWRVRVRHPWTGGSLAEVLLRDAALGTSAATFQHLVHEGRKLGHVLDPRTGWPASGLDCVSVLAPTAALADALSTAFYVGGPDLARRYCADHPEVGAILLPEGADRPEVVGAAAREYTLSIAGAPA